MARYAMKRCAWFHTSHKYGSTMDVLAHAFAEMPGRIPRCICKLSGDSIDEIRSQVELQINRLSIPRIAIGQTHMGGALASGFAKGDENVLNGFRRLKEEGLVEGFTVEVHPWTSRQALDNLLTHAGQDIFVGYSFYYNPLQRYALNELFAEIIRQKRPILALRAMGGGAADRQAQRPASAEDFMQARAAELLPLYRDAGFDGWADFALSFELSRPNVVCAIGSAQTPRHLDECLSAAAGPCGFREDTAARIAELQTKWSDEKDRFAAEWTM